MQIICFYKSLEINFSTRLDKHDEESLMFAAWKLLNAYLELKQSLLAS